MSLIAVYKKKGYKLFHFVDCWVPAKNRDEAIELRKRFLQRQKEISMI